MRPRKETHTIAVVSEHTSARTVSVRCSCHRSDLSCSWSAWLRTTSQLRVKKVCWWGPCAFTVHGRVFMCFMCVYLLGIDTHSYLVCYVGTVAYSYMECVSVWVLYVFWWSVYVYWFRIWTEGVCFYAVGIVRIGCVG